MTHKWNNIYIVLLHTLCIESFVKTLHWFILILTARRPTRFSRCVFFLKGCEKQNKLSYLYSVQTKSGASDGDREEGGTGDLCDCEIVAVAHAGALIDSWFSCMEIYDSGPSYLIVSTRQTQKWKPNCPLCTCVPLGLFVCVRLKLADRSIIPPTELVVFAQILNELHLLTTIMTLYLDLFANCGTAKM